MDQIIQITAMAFPEWLMKPLIAYQDGVILSLHMNLGIILGLNTHITIVGHMEMATQ